MIINGLLVNRSDGKVELMDFINEKSLASLFEAFVRKYYQVEYKGKLVASGETINWQIDSEYENNKMIELLPQMHTDITLFTFDDLYSFFLKQNKNIEVAGMLLYAKTDEEMSPDIETKVMGSNMYVRTIDLNKTFKDIERQLYEISLLVNNNIQENN